MRWLVMQILPKLAKYIVIIGIIVAVVVFGKIQFDKFANKDPEIVRVPVYIERPPTEPTIVEKTHFRETFVEEIENRQELITLEVVLTQEIQLDDSWSDFEIFKKNQNIIFKGIGLYTTDLSKISENSVLIDDERKIILVRLDEPTPKLVSIDENATAYETIESGVLRSSKEIKLSTSEQQALMVQVKSAMEEKLSEQELKEQAESSARDSITKLYDGILKSIGVEDYKVEIVFG